MGINIGCYLISKGKFEKVVLPEKLVLPLVTSLRNNGKEIVHFGDRSIEVEGIYIPGKDSKVRLMVFESE